MSITEKLKTYRISTEEYEKIIGLLKREPKNIELAIYSALWSEHCSYKSSKIHLKNLYSKSKKVLQSFGENAGIVDLGEGEKVAFKMESHNHPSFIEPYQGATTGVGGILRDIFTMGARPIALANYLCFGDPTAARMSELVDGVVRGIGGYGNPVGVPTITGQTNFDSSYNNNILVNALAVGLFGPEDPICLSKAQGVGNYVVYVGAKTGRDGIHGASMASESFEEGSESKRPTVQIGDPFYEKLLIEACLEVMKKNLVVAIQDMGAAGLTSSSFEMAEKGNVGLKMDLSKVPLRDSTMTPEDILLSESQERMLLISEPSKFSEIEKVFKKWGLDATVIGEVTSNPNVTITWGLDVLTELNPDLVVSRAPLYERPYDEVALKYNEKLAKPLETNENLEAKLESIHGGSKSWIYNQYDQRVGAKTAADCSEPVGILRLPFSHRGLSLALGCRPQLMQRDAFWGGRDSIIYPVIEMAIKGFVPQAVTDCLNFGNPEKKHIMSEFVASLKGMNEACELFEAPIISGNVSFYNETQGKNITSTPSTGLVGLRDDISFLPVSYFSRLGADLWLLTWSDYWFDFKNGKGFLGNSLTGLNEFVKALIGLTSGNEVIASRIVSQFGLGYTLARMCTTEIGAEVKTPVSFDISPFYSAILVTPPQLTESFKNKLQKTFDIPNVSHQYLGVTKANTLTLNNNSFDCNKILSCYQAGWEKHFASLN